MDAQSMGAAAALQALKKFTGTGGQSSAASQGGQSQLVSGCGHQNAIRSAPSANH